MDAGVVLTKGAKGALVEGNTFVGQPARRPPPGVARRHGPRQRHHRPHRPAGRRRQRRLVWNAPGALIEGNDVRFGRDGIFTRVSKHDVFRGNRFEKTRFAIHYMYTNDSVIEDNVSIDNTVGYAIMFSDRLKIVGNVSDGDRDHGLLLNSSNRSEISGNRVTGRELPAARWLTCVAGRRRRHGARDPTTPVHAAGDRIGPEKCLFVYNANKNVIEDNRFEGCAHRHPLHRRRRGQRRRRQRLHRQPDPGEVRRHPHPRLVRRRPRQLLVRQRRPSTSTATASPTPPTARTTSSTG